MSLDVYLESDAVQLPAVAPRIFVREGGSTKEISRDEWDRRYPGREPVTVLPGEEPEPIYSANITHNLNRMATEAGIYKALWRPEEIGATHARDIIGLLRDGLALLNTDPDRFRAFNPESGWGDYEGLCRFTADYLAACERNPDARIRVSR